MRDLNELAFAPQDSIEPRRSRLKPALRVRMLLLHAIRRGEVTEFANEYSRQNKKPGYWSLDFA
jgi:hypothetical protein